VRLHRALATAGRRALFLDTLAVARPEVGADAAGRPTAAWLEWDADRAVAAGALAAAASAYEEALAAGGDPTRLLLKLADLRFLAGDAAGERELRERIYGSLQGRPAAVEPPSPPGGVR
jgi:hypothetical protein